MWPPFCLTTSCKRTFAFVTTFWYKSSESARHNFTMWALSFLFLMENMFNVTTVLPHNLLQTNLCILHNFLTQVFRKRAAQLHYVGPELLVPNEEHVQCDNRFASQPLADEPLHSSQSCAARFLKICVEILWRMQGFVCKRLWGKTVVTLNMFFIRNNFPAHKD